MTRQEIQRRVHELLIDVSDDVAVDGEQCTDCPHMTREWNPDSGQYERGCSKWESDEVCKVVQEIHDFPEQYKRSA